MNIPNFPWEIIITIFLSVMSSSGFWAYMNNRSAKKKAETQLLLGLAHDRIIFLGESYLRRGSITKDEYEDFRKYLYDPYENFGGNGLAEKMMEAVNKLPMDVTRRNK